MQLSCNLEFITVGFNVNVSKLSSWVLQTGQRSAAAATKQITHGLSPEKEMVRYLLTAVLVRRPLSISSRGPPWPSQGCHQSRLASMSSAQGSQRQLCASTWQRLSPLQNCAECWCRCRARLGAWALAPLHRAGGARGSELGHWHRCRALCARYTQAAAPQGAAAGRRCARMGAGNAIWGLCRRNSGERPRRVLRKKTSVELRLIYIFTSAHLHICTSPTFAHLYISSHLHICTSTPLLIFTSAHLQLCSSSYLHICTSTSTSSHLHISHLHLSLFFSFSLKAGAVPGHHETQPSAEIARVDGAKCR